MKPNFNSVLLSRIFSAMHPPRPSTTSKQASQIINQAKRKIMLKLTVDLRVGARVKDLNIIGDEFNSLILVRNFSVNL